MSATVTANPSQGRVAPGRRGQPPPRGWPVAPLSAATLEHIRASVAAAPPLHAETLERLARLLPSAAPVRAHTATQPRELAGRRAA